MSTSSLLAVVPLNPRALIAHWRESTCATCRLVARRNASGRLDAPERRMSSRVITWIAEAVCDNRSARFETEVTSRFISCSMLSCFNTSADTLVSRRWTAESGCWASPGAAQQTTPSVRTSDVAAATVLVSANCRHPMVCLTPLGSRVIPHLTLPREKLSLTRTACLTYHYRAPATMQPVTGASLYASRPEWS